MLKNLFLTILTIKSSSLGFFLFLCCFFFGINGSFSQNLQNLESVVRKNIYPKISQENYAINPSQIPEDPNAPKVNNVENSANLKEVNSQNSLEEKKTVESNLQEQKTSDVNNAKINSNREEDKDSKNDVISKPNNRQNKVSSNKNTQKNKAQQGPNVNQDAKLTAEERKARREKKKAEKETKIISIMLDREEQKQVETALQALKSGKVLKTEDLEGEKKETSKKTEQKVVKQPVIPVKEQSRIYLNAILYLSKDNWIVWINEGKIVPDKNVIENPIYLKKVTNNKVWVRWVMGLSKWKVLSGKENIEVERYKINKKTNQVEIDFVLETNQTYNLVNDTVTEGKVGTIKDKTSENFEPINKATK